MGAAATGYLSSGPLRHKWDELFTRHGCFARITGSRPVNYKQGEERAEFSRGTSGVCRKTGDITGRRRRKANNVPTSTSAYLDEIKLCGHIFVYLLRTNNHCCAICPRLPYPIRLKKWVSPCNNTHLL